MNVTRGQTQTAYGGATDGIEDLVADDRRGIHVVGFLAITLPDGSPRRQIKDDETRRLTVERKDKVLTVRGW
jgi:hypothetical protein